MDPKKPDDGNSWSEADIAAMLTGRDERWASLPSYDRLPVENSPGFHPEDGDYVIDPDYLELMGLSDPAELIRRKDDISR
jgi:kynurenine formamidase